MASFNAILRRSPHFEHGGNLMDEEIQQWYRQHENGWFGMVTFDEDG